MPSERVETLRRKLEGQNFRVREIDPQTWEVKAPEGVVTPLQPSGIARIHTMGIGSERSKMNAIMDQLKKIGFDPEWQPPKSDSGGGTTDEELTARTGLEVYHREAPADDPDDRWVSLTEAGEIIGISASGVQQRILSGKLRGVKLPVELHEKGGRVRTIQAVHVHVKELKASGGRRSNGGRPPSLTSPVKSRYDTTTAAGRLNEATARAKAAMRKLQQAAEEFNAAATDIEREASGALEEIQAMRRKQKEIEMAADKLISRF